MKHQIVFVQILAVAVEGVNGYLSPYDKDVLVKITGNPGNVLVCLG
jgi:hypothetical protein